ncbi:MAG: hypothetical protein K2X77_02295, partial [Candidatus Obscuribacterales bacterium]|nr:hypothetical protein [Candidatus Obscuribacterales bacterium]
MRVLSPRFLRSFKGIAERDGSLGATPSVALTDKNIQSEGDIPLDRLPGREAGKMPALPGSNSGQRRPDGPPCSQKPIGFSPDDLYRIINIHPSLLPSFPGAHAYEDAWEAGVPESGITIHLVDELVDHGPILQQGSFARQRGDTIDSFKARGLQLEHQLYPAVLNQIARKGIIRVLEEFAGITSSPSASNCSDPASSGVLPASNCSDSASSGVLPASNCSDSASSGVLPASNCSDSASSGVLPASNCSDPGSSGVLPASNCSDPGSAGILPASNCSAPGSSGILPASNCSDPGSAGILPASDCSDSASSGVLPASNCSDPGSAGILPASNCSDPGSAGVLPASNCSDSASSGVLPASNCSDSASSGVLPASNCSDS